MNYKLFKTVGLAVAMAALGFICSLGIHGQQIPGATRPGSAAMTTNWIGYLVVGGEDAVDRIAPGPHPTTVSQVQIGLRSDGVVLWRSAPVVK